MDGQAIHLTRLFFIFLVGLSSQAQAQSSSESWSYYLDSASPCSFRGALLLHDQRVRLGPCTACRCNNGTTNCIIEACPPVSCGVWYPDVCCTFCVYKLVVNSTNIFDVSFNFVGDSVKSRFSLDISVKTSHSNAVVGENLWKLSAWISTNADGHGTKYALNDNIFSVHHAGKEFKKHRYPPWRWTNLYYNMTLRGGPCDQCEFMCVEFGQAGDLNLSHDLPFQFKPVKFETERLVDCVSLPKREGIEGAGIGCAYEGISFHDKTVIRPDNCTECMCLNGTVNCTKENCDGGTDVPEDCCPSYRPTQRIEGAGIGCAYEGISFHDKTVIRPDNCTECMCLNGTVNCTKENCDGGTDVPEECCPSYRPTQTDYMTTLYTDEMEDGDSTRPTLPTIVIVILSLSASLIFVSVICLLIRRKLTTNSELKETNNFGLVRS
ncbi:kielin/chordin-like protein [Apostichopus japonicus]|uniref:kielin/chordin-like protein n=1 Tax=Stichopus japonicus TaxID=307972 RepID=UPI003AB3FDA5